MNAFTKMLMSTACAVAASAAFAQESPSDAPMALSTASRAEVLADLQIWQRSGMAALQQGEAGPQVFDAPYRSALAAYTAMRESPTFALLVRRIAAEIGERTEVAAQ